MSPPSDALTMPVRVAFKLRDEELVLAFFAGGTNSMVSESLPVAPSAPHFLPLLLVAEVVGVCML